MKKMLNPYSGDHRIFKTSNSLKLPNDYNFNDLYNRLKKGNHDKFKNLNLELFKSVESIFKSLKDIATGKDEVLFLEELHDEIKSTLYHDIDFYRNKYYSKTIESDLIKEFEKKKAHIISLYPITTWMINQLAKKKVGYFKKQAEIGKTKREELSTNGGLLNQIICLLLNIDFNLQGVNRLISSYTGDTYNVGGLSLELSISNSKWWETNYSAYSQKPKTNYYHFDESISKPKAIVYLTDVEKEGGPVKYVERFENILKISNLQSIVGRVIGNIARTKKSKIYHLFNHKYHQTFGCPEFINFFNMLPSELKFSSHIGWDIIPGSELESRIIKEEKILTGLKGKALIFDGSELLHRGGMVEKGSRVVLQVIFEKKQRFHIIKKLYRKLLK